MMMTMVLLYLDPEFLLASSLQCYSICTCLLQLHYSRPRDILLKSAEAKAMC